MDFNTFSPTDQLVQIFVDAFARAGVVDADVLRLAHAQARAIDERVKELVDLPLDAFNALALGNAERLRELHALRLTEGRTDP